MLVLSRKIHEKIIIGDNIVIQVVAISGARVRIGITAPNEVPVLRGELSFFAEQAHVKKAENGDNQVDAPFLAAPLA